MASSPLSIRPFLLLAATLLLASGLANAQTQQVYRYTDINGSIVYSDKPPPPNAKDAQAKRITKNSIETSDVSFSVQQAQERFPVTLFTFSCGAARRVARCNPQTPPNATAGIRRL